MIDTEIIEKMVPYMDGYGKIVGDGEVERSAGLFKIKGSMAKEELVVGALIARIATLSVYLMFNPAGWNYLMAAFSLRAQVECYITLAWILENVNENSQKYIATSIRRNERNSKEYGEYLSNLEKNHASFANEREAIKRNENEKEKWRQSQQVEWGYSRGMPDIATRAREANVLLEYMDMYNWLCEHSHNSWYLLYHYNTKLMPELGDKIRVPVMGAEFNMHIMEKSAQYLSVAYQMVDEKYKLSTKITLPIKYWKEHEIEMVKVLGI